jgi:hypothetical protein
MLHKAMLAKKLRKQKNCESEAHVLFRRLFVICNRAEKFLKNEEYQNETRDHWHCFIISTFLHIIKCCQQLRSKAPGQVNS